MNFFFSLSFSFHVCNGCVYACVVFFFVYVPSWGHTHYPFCISHYIKFHLLSCRYVIFCSLRFSINSKSFNFQRFIYWMFEGLAVILAAKWYWDMYNENTYRRLISWFIIFDTNICYVGHLTDVWFRYTAMYLVYTFIFSAITILIHRFNLCTFKHDFHEYWVFYCNSKIFHNFSSSTF